jgi:superfamily II DNA/RNA helicase
MKIVEVDGVHRSLPHVRHIFEDTKGADKYATLRQVLDRNTGKMHRTLIFCNTVDSCRATEYAVNDYEKTEKESVCCYHGDMNSQEREASLASFREGKYCNFALMGSNRFSFV